MRKALIAAVLLVPAMIVTALPLGAQRRGGAGGAVTFAVLVSDPSGAPIPGVKIVLTGAAERTARTEGGRAVFEGLPAGAYRFRFDRDGFVPLERELAGRGGAPIDVKVTLTPAPEPPPPPPAPVPPPPPPRIDAKLVVLDMPAFIERHYVGKTPGKVTPLGCSTGGVATLIQINEPIAEHTHADADEFVYVIAGQGSANLAGRQEPLGAAVFMMIPRGTPHALTATKKPLVLISTRAGESCAP
jgi:quercetin dioxygenase-like cupin family protein